MATRRQRERKACQRRWHNILAREAEAGLRAWHATDEGSERCMPFIVNLVDEPCHGTWRAPDRVIVPQWIEDRIRMWGEDGKAYQSNVLGTWAKLSGP